MTVIRIRSLGPSDTETILPLFKEMEEFYETSDVLSIEEIRRRVQRALFDPQSRICQALVAEYNGTVAGIALFTPIFPASHLSTGMLLKDLFVCRDCRRIGVATQLLACLAQLAVERGYSRIDWTTEAGNTAARATYDKIGASLIGKVNYRLEGQRLRGMAARITHECKAG
jgi:GNAT superfamily N-acetyltransferase